MIVYLSKDDILLSHCCAVPAVVEYMYRIYPEKDATENDYEYVPIMLPADFFSGSNPQPSNIMSQQHTLQFDMRTNPHQQQQVIVLEIIMIVYFGFFFWFWCLTRYLIGPDVLIYQGYANFENWMTMVYVPRFMIRSAYYIRFCHVWHLNMLKY